MHALDFSLTITFASVYSSTEIYIFEICTAEPYINIKARPIKGKKPILPKIILPRKISLYIKATQGNHIMFAYSIFSDDAYSRLCRNVWRGEKGRAL